MSYGDEDHTPASRGDIRYANQSIHEKLNRLEIAIYMCFAMLVALVLHSVFGLQPFWK